MGKKIFQFSQYPSNDPTVLKNTLDAMVNEGILFKHKDFYLTCDSKEWVDRRMDNNQRAAKFIKRARWMTQVIRRFPFVRAVILSGSLSKNVMPKDGDVDYFIITQPGRLWIARTFLVLFKKLFLLNSKKYFCVNYFIDEDHLEIEEKNRFTATEIATLLPVYNAQLYDRFYQANSWIKNYLPHSHQYSSAEIQPASKPLIRRILEGMLSGKIGDQLDIFFMKKTIQFWNKKFKTLNPNNFSIALKSRRYVSKHHPQDFQHKVMNAYEQCIQRFEERQQIQLERSGIWQLKKESQ